MNYTNMKLKKKKIRVNIAKIVILKAIIIFSTETY